MKLLKIINNFMMLLYLTGYRKSKIHKTYIHYLRHAWELSEEISKDDLDESKEL